MRRHQVLDRGDPGQEARARRQHDAGLEEDRAADRAVVVDLERAVLPAAADGLQQRRDAELRQRALHHDAVALRRRGLRDAEADLRHARQLRHLADVPDDPERGELEAPRRGHELRDRIEPGGIAGARRDDLAGLHRDPARRRTGAITDLDLEELPAHTEGLQQREQVELVEPPLHHLDPHRRLRGRPWARRGARRTRDRRLARRPERRALQRPEVGDRAQRARQREVERFARELEPGIARRRHEHAQRVAPVHPARGRGDHAPGLEHEPADQLSAPGAELEPQAGSPQARHLRDARQVEVGQGAGQERHDGSTSDPATTLRTIASLAAGGCTLSRPIFIAVDTRP